MSTKEVNKNSQLSNNTLEEQPQKKKKPGRPPIHKEKTPIPRNGISQNPNFNSNIMELEYDDPTKFKKIFNLCKSMAVKNIKMEFDMTEIKMKSSDHFNKNYNLLTIKGSRLNHYYCKLPFSIILNSKNIEKVFKKIDKNYDTITIVSRQDTMYQSINIIFKNKSISSEEYHIVNLVENTDFNIDKNINDCDYKNYPIKFELSSKFFKKAISDIASFNEDTHEQFLTIEKMKGIPLQFKYQTITKTIRAYTIFKDTKKIKLESTIGEKDIFSVSIRIMNIKPLSDSPISDTIKIFVDNHKDIVFQLNIDDGTFDFLIFTKIVGT